MYLLHLLTFCALCTFICCASFSAAQAANPDTPLWPGVDAEELVYIFEPANNGAGPMWCFGSTCLVRVGQDVFVSGLETLEGVPPLHNVRWLLFKRGEKGWELEQADEKNRQREPCPLAASWDGHLFLSNNPTLTAPGTRNGPAQPQLLEFSTRDPRGPFKTLFPQWDGQPAFTEHSYRAFAADGPNGELLLLNVLGHQAQYWTFRDRGGNWASCGKLTFPMGHDYEKPEPIRLCYPVVALRNSEAHVLAISDIIEPVKAWRDYKLILHKGQRWDYDFRRLFYTWTPDITQVPFSPWVELASQEKTAGHISQLDVWLGPRGKTHLLWLEKTVNETKMRDRFFPDTRITTSLVHGIVEEGKLVQRSVLAIGGEGESSILPGYARFQATPGGRLFVFFFCSGTDPQGNSVAENRLMELFSDGTHGTPLRVPLERPFTSFMTATERGGSPPSDNLEIIGAALGRAGISYARISLFNRIVADFQSKVVRTSTGSLATFDALRSTSATGKIASWEWDIDGTAARGPKVTHAFQRSGRAHVSLTVKDGQGNQRMTTRTIRLPVAPADFGLETWGLSIRTEAESFTREGGGTVHLQTDKLGASALSLSHWDSKGLWLEWEVDIPRTGDYFLLMRHAAPHSAERVIIIDGQQQHKMLSAATGGSGSSTGDNWGFTILAGPDRQPLTMHLEAGIHRVRIENQDGRGLCLDYLEWFPEGKPLSKNEILRPAARSVRILGESGLRYAIPLYGTICPSQLRSDGGHCVMALLGSHYPGDNSLQSPHPSQLQLFEDGKELGPAHAAHVDIRQKGRGRFSHWRTSVRFSASDDSDPRTNGRTYTWQIREP